MIYSESQTPMLIRSAYVAFLALALFCFAVFDAGPAQKSYEPTSTLDSLNPSPIAELAANKISGGKIPEAIEFDRCIANLNLWSQEQSFEKQNSPLTDVSQHDHSPKRSSSQLQATASETKIELGDSDEISIPAQLPQIRLVAFTYTRNSEDDDSQPKVELFEISEELVSEIDRLRSNPQATGWATNAITVLDAIAKSPTNSNQLPVYFQQLETLLNQMPQLTTAVWNASDQSQQAMQETSQIGQIGYKISRRLSVWRAITRSQSKNGDAVTAKFRSANYGRISFEELDPRWVEYLKLEDYKSAFESLQPDPKKQRKTARAILARIYSPVLQSDQAAYIQQIIDPELVGVLKHHASKTISTADLLKSVEKFETQNSSLSGYYLNDHYQGLLWSDDLEKQSVAAELQTHYRNANFRLSVSDRLLNRMIPALPSTAERVSENINGAVVRGNSQVSNHTRVAFVPNPSKLQLQLETDGHVRSDTVARTKTFRILNQGEARFKVQKQLLIGRDGINSSQRPYSASNGNQHVVGVESKLDNVPILGWVARRLAEKKLREDQPETNRLFRNKVTSSAESRVEQEVDKGLAQLRNYGYNNLLQPLISMDLEPEPLELQTTYNQLIMRYRLAGHDQMAANTARPRDSGNSLLSFQIHQSAINNAIARIGLKGETFTGKELQEHMRQVFGLPHYEKISDEREQKKAQIKFASVDPIHIGFEKDRLAITLNLKSLKIGEKGKRFKNISMKAVYQVQTSGMQVFLTQDDNGTLIRGKRLKLREKAAISTIMKVLFKKNYDFDALPAQFAAKINGQNLEISQLVVANGWIGVSIDDRNSAPFNQSTIATTPAASPQRLGDNLRRVLNRR